MDIIMDESDQLHQEYKGYLQSTGKSSHTTRAYLQDLQAFAFWFRTSSGEDLSPRAVDPRDITEYRGYLLRTGTKPATVNRRLISLRRFFKWAHRQRLVEENPFDMLERVYVREQSSQEIAPRWLDGNEQLALLRAVRKSGQGQASGRAGNAGNAGKIDTGGDGGQSSEGSESSDDGSIRDMAVIQTLLGTGLRISELANLRMEDVEVSERKGLVRVREGKGVRAGLCPLITGRVRYSFATSRSARSTSNHRNNCQSLGTGRAGSSGQVSLQVGVRPFRVTLLATRPKAHFSWGRGGRSMCEASTIW